MTKPLTRRDRNAEATRHDILAAGHEVFAQRPYAEVTGLEICARAGVTRGALQHHFGSKLGLFMAVFEGLQHGVVSAVADGVAEHSDPWEQARAGVAAFLAACTGPAYQAVVLKEGPAAIGWQRWRELDTDYFADMVHGLIVLLAADGLADHPPALLAAVIRGTLTELSFEIAQSDDHHRALADALAVVDRLLAGFRVDPAGAASADGTRMRIGVGQLRASTSTYLERAAAGTRVEVMRRGRVVAEIVPPV